MMSKEKSISYIFFILFINLSLDAFNQNVVQGFDKCTHNLGDCIEACQSSSSTSNVEDCYNSCHANYVKCNCGNGICILNPMYSRGAVENCSTCPDDCKCPDGWYCDPKHPDAVIGAPGSAWNSWAGCVQIDQSIPSSPSDDSWEEMIAYLIYILLGIIGFWVIKSIFRKRRNPNLHSIEDSQVVYKNDSPDDWADVSFCNNCGSSIQEGQKFCGGCGTKMSFS